MPEKLIMVRESEWREMREALHAAQEFIANEYRDPSQEPHGEWLAPEARPVHEKLCAALAKSETIHPTPDGCGREWEQIEAAARAIADAWGETWECCCTEQRGLDCDCGDAMSDERDWGDERLTREDCRKAARAALSALTAGGDDG